MNTILWVLICLLLGTPFGTMLFAEGGDAALVVAAAVYFLLGFAVGSIRGPRWQMAALIGWPGVAIALAAAAGGHFVSAVALLGLAPLPATLGGWLGSRLRVRLRAEPLAR